MNQENNNIKMIMAIIIVIIMLYASIDKTLYKGPQRNCSSPLFFILLLFVLKKH